MITVIGLGGKADELTLEAKKVISNATTVAVKTFKTAAGKAVGASISMDEVFDESENFDRLDETIANKLAALEKNGDVVYCTDGDGMSDGVYRALERSGADVTLVRGVSCGIRRACDARLTMTAFGALAARPYIDGGVALEITEIGDVMLAGEVKLYLLEYYAPETEILFSSCGKTSALSLEELDRQKKYSFDACLFIEGNRDLDKARYTFADLMRIMSRLTAPDGCPWDKAQTHESIRTNLIEEAYEAVDAIDSGDLDAMREEIGDVLLQAVFHCDMAARTGEFTAGDVISELCGKLYSRHTHIFGKDRAGDSAEALKFWENAKAVEKSYTSLYDILTRLPKGFPSLLRAQKAYKKAVKAGRAEKPEQKTSETELGDKLFDLVRIASASGVDAETALNKKIGEFIEGFKD